ncbi:MAG: dtd [Chlamydiales bacterium]|jgi:D-tyrosyl-tRNA(Tyr) deacylase|nr:dtd [Chlamydiales bacterium]
MRLVIQRVKSASVSIEGQTYSAIDKGLLVLLGIQPTDAIETIPWMIHKLIHMRIFADEQDKMNRDIQEVKGEILVVSQFTLYGDCAQGRRPSFTKSASGAVAQPLYNEFVHQLTQKIPIVKTGQFAAKMEVTLINDGPVTMILESPLGQTK